MPDETNIRSAQLPVHESGVRRMVAVAQGSKYVAYRSLNEARADADGVVVFEGDYGGQIYLVARASTVSCSEEVLQQLLSDLDVHAWSEPNGARLYYESLPVGATVAGGMGGGVVTTDVWVHERLRKFETAARAVLGGQRDRLKGAPVA